MALADQLTLSSLAFDKVYSDAQGGSKRTDASRGVNLPQHMFIKHQQILEKSTSRTLNRSLLEFDRYQALSGGGYAPIKVKLTVEAPVDSGVAAADILAAVELVAQTIQEDDSGINKAEDIFVTKLQ